MKHLFLRRSALGRLLCFILCALLFPVSVSAQDQQGLTLQAAVEIALEHNPQLRALQRKVAAARSRAPSTWWWQDPILSMEWEGIPRGAGLQQFEERRFTLRQEIDFPLNMIWRNRFAAREVEVVVREYEVARLETRAAAISAYTDFVATREALALARKRDELSREFYEKAEIRRRVGEVGAIESVRARVELAQARNEFRMAESDFQAAKAALNAILGRDADENLTARDSLTYKPLQLSLQEIKQLALQRHPQILWARARIGAAGYLKKLAWGSFLPSIEATGFQQNLGGNPNFYGIEVGLRIPFWFLIRQRAEIQAASAELVSVKSEAEGVRLRLDAEIEAAFSRMQAVKKQVEMYHTELLQQANEVYRIALRSYEEGEIGYLQLLEAQRTLIEVRRGYIETLANYQKALAELERSSAVMIFE